MKLVPIRYISLCKTLSLNECNTYTDEHFVPGSSSDNEDSDSSDQFYNNLTKSFHSSALESDSA